MPELLKKGAKVAFSSNAATQEPELAAYVVRVLTLWSQIEMTQGQLLGALLDGEINTVTQMFLALESESARRAVLLSAINSKMQEPERQATIELVEKIRKRGRDRHMLAHAQWGISPDEPDALIMADPRQQVLHLAEFTNALVNIGKDEAIKRENGEKYRIYRKKEFEEIENRLREVFKPLTKITFALLHRKIDKIKEVVATLGPWPKR